MPKTFYIRLTSLITIICTSIIINASIHGMETPAPIKDREEEDTTVRILSAQIMPTLLELKKNEIEHEKYGRMLGRIVPKWPSDESIPQKCRSIAKLAQGPYKGESARIERSGWSEWGIDRISSAKIERIFSINAPFLWKFSLDVPTESRDFAASIYMGKIGDAQCVIPESWLSAQDKINMFNFHRYELEVLAKQLFDSKSDFRTILMSKIKNEIYRSHSVFLHAAFLEACKQNDSEILTDRTILYNSLEILDDELFKNVKKKSEDLDDAAIRSKIKELLSKTH